MIFYEEIRDILRSKGISSGTDVNKTIFAIATLGLLIEQEELIEIAIHCGRADRTEFEHRILSAIPLEREKKIADTVFRYIPLVIDNKLLLYIIEVVTKFDLKHIISDYAIYDCTLGSSEYNKAEYPITSVQWLDFLFAEIFKTHGGKSLYNNDCGTGDFVTMMLNIQYADKAIGMAYNKTDAEIANIKSYFLDKDLEIRESNSFFYPALQDDEKVDMALCTYPLLYKYEKEEAYPMIDSWDFNFAFNKRYSANLLWMINALQSIKEDGIVVSFVPNGALFNNIDEEVRKYLVENNYIDTIIGLPQGILPNSRVATSIVILKKNRTNLQSIKMIDASEIFTEHRRYRFLTQENIAQIMDLYTSDKQTNISFYVEIDDILKNGAYLGLNRYCAETIENAVALDDVVDKIFRGYQLGAKELDKLTLDEGEESEYRIINISDIQAEGFVSSDLRPIKADDKKKYDKFLVEDGDIIITAKNTTIKSAIYRSNGDYKAVLSGNLIAIRVNQKKINPYYLKAFIDSESGDMAIKSIQTGTSIITINANSLKDMKVSLLSTEEQEVIGNKYKKNLELIIDLAERYKNAASYSNQIFEEVRRRTAES